MPPEKVPQFVSDHKLQHFSEPKDFQSGLASLLAQDPKNNDAVISWIQDNVSEEERKKTPKDFIRTLARVVTESCFKYDELKCQWSLNEEQFGQRTIILKKYVDAKLENEKQILYGLQHMMHEMQHPNKLLSMIFYCLYNDDVISQEGFDAWLNCNDKAEEQGKGVASKSTTHFFTWMREPDQDDGDKDDE